MLAGWRLLPSGPAQAHRIQLKLESCSEQAVTGKKDIGSYPCHQYILQANIDGHNESKRCYI